MSRDTKTDGCTDRYEHPEVSAVLFVSPALVGATQHNESNATNDRVEPFRPVTSLVAIPCASETDDGDYETSSEGPILSKLSRAEVHGAPKESLCGYSEEKSTSLSKRAGLDSDGSPIKREVIPDPQSKLVESWLTQQTAVAHSLVSVSKSLVDSRSLPILRSKTPSDTLLVNLKATDVASESSMARKKKMSMIVERMVPLMAPYPSMASVTTGSTSNFRSEQYEARRFETKMALPVLRADTTSTVINDEKSEELVTRVALCKTINNHRAADQDSRQDATTCLTSVKEEETTPANLTNDDDLADDDRNPRPPIESTDFLPNPPAVPDDFARPEKRRRMNALLMLDHELGPLRCQLSEIVGKARALGLNDANFDLDLCSRSDQRLDLTDRSTLSPNVSGGLFDRGQTSRAAVTSRSLLENRSGLVGKTTLPSSTFPVVDKFFAPGESRTSGFNASDSSRQRQEALSFALGDPTRALERLDKPASWSSGRLGNSVSYLPTGAIRASQRENVLLRVLDECPRDKRTFNGNFLPYHKSLATIERDMFAWKAWSTHSRVHVNRSSLFCETERRSGQNLLRAVESSRMPNDNESSDSRFDQLHRWNGSRTICRSNYTSTSTIVRMMDGNRSCVGREAASKRSTDAAVLVHSRNSVATQAGLAAIRGGRHHKSTQTETELVAEDGRIRRPNNLRWIDRDAGSDRQIPRAVSAAVCAAPQIRVVSVNTEFRATVVKRYTNRAVSPIGDSPRARDARSVVSSSSSSSLSSGNLLLAAVSSVFVQQVRELPEVARSGAVVDEKNDVAKPERDPRPRKLDSRPTAKDPLKFCESKEDRIIPPKSGKTQSPRSSPVATGKITIAPTIYTGDIPRVVYPNFVISGYTDKPTSKLNHRVVLVQAKRSRSSRSPSKGENGTSPGDVSESHACSTEEELANENLQDASEVSVSRVSRSGLCAQRENRGPSTTSVVLRDARRPIQAKRSSGSTRLGRKAREYHRSAWATVRRAIPGMRSSPEDFFCDT